MKVVDRSRFIFPNGGEMSNLITGFKEKKYKVEVQTVMFDEEWPAKADTWDEQ